MSRGGVQKDTGRMMRPALCKNDVKALNEPNGFLALNFLFPRSIDLKDRGFRAEKAPKPNPTRSDSSQVHPGKRVPGENQIKISRMWTWLRNDRHRRDDATSSEVG